MSFAGLWLQDGAPAETELEPALSCFGALARISRQSVVSASGNVAFGYLTTVPERRLHTPPERTSGLIAVGDVRLDNRRELLAELATLAPVSDISLVLLGYQRWGEQCAARFIGDFAFAIWNDASAELFMARDACGTRPLFYALGPGRVAFASRSDALPRIRKISRELDERAVIDFLGEFPEDEQRTLFASVRRLAPGCSITVRANGASQREFFNASTIAPRVMRDDRDYAEALLEALRRSVARRGVDEAECGVMLSGGLDSTMVCCLAAEQRRAQNSSKLFSFSAIFPDTPACDERAFQEPVVARARTHHLEIEPRSTGSSADFRLLARTFGDPSAIGLHWLAWPIAEAAAKNGVSVLLTGIDGDRVVSHGGALFAELARSRQFRKLVHESFSVSDSGLLRQTRILLSHLFVAALPERAIGIFDRLDRRKTRRFQDALGILKSSVVRSVDVARRLEQQTTRPRDCREAHLRSLAASDRNADVELLDRIGFAFGIEYRHPFFDRDVLELCISMPGEQKRHDGFSRYVLRNAMRQVAPEAVRTRRRDTTLDAGFGRWIHGWARSALDPDATDLERLSPWIDVDKLRKAVHRFQASRADAGPVDFVWRCMVFSKWLEYFDAAVSA